MNKILSYRLYKNKNKNYIVVNTDGELKGDVKIEHRTYKIIREFYSNAKQEYTYIGKEAA